jgi:hypothetical protein
MINTPRWMTAMLTSLAILCTLELGTAAASPLYLYMAPNGNDANNGLSPSSAVQSLTGIQAIVKEHIDGGFSDNIFVEIASGLYLDQWVEWTRTIPGHWITFEAINPASPPLFDGSSLPTQAWFAAINLGISQIQLRNLHVRNYVNAVAFHYSHHNELYGMKLEYIGGIGNGTAGYGALHLRDSSDNSITNSHFIAIRPDPREGAGSCGGLHAIYAVDSSSRNTISGNWFEDSCGDGVIKLRNGAHDNLIAGNRFLHTGSATHILKTTHQDDECMPLGNWFQYNEVCKGFFDQPMEFVGRAEYGKTPGWCEPETPDRVPYRTRGNVYATPATHHWCTSLTQAQIDQRHADFDDPVPGICGCENSGLGNVCVVHYNACSAGFTPTCNPKQGTNGDGCGGCTCQ